MPSFIDITGSRFAKLQAAWPAGARGTRKNRKTIWFCGCDCGGYAYVVAGDLRSGHIQSCGCLRPVKKYNCNSPDPTVRMLAAAESRARRNDLPFDLDPEDIIIPAVCPYLGMALVRNTGGAKDNSPSLDKIRPELGYIKGNVQVISSKANRCKSDLSPEELVTFAKSVLRKDAA